MTGEQREAVAFCLNAIDYLDLKYERNFGAETGFIKTQLRTGKQSVLTDSEVFARLKAMIDAVETRIRVIETEMEVAKRQLKEAEEILLSIGE